MHRTEFYTIDISKIKGKGDFKCPKCGARVSPDDENEDVYTILNTFMKGGCLEKLILQCNKCGSEIHLVGFHILDGIRL